MDFEDNITLYTGCGKLTSFFIWVYSYKKGSYLATPVCLYRFVDIYYNFRIIICNISNSLNCEKYLNTVKSRFDIVVFPENLCSLYIYLVSAEAQYKRYIIFLYWRILV
jgi:hypothetical protein